MVETLCEVATSKHPDIHADGIEIIAALSPEESALLTDMAVGWLTPEERYGLLQAPETLLKKLAESHQQAAALRVARALLQIWNENGEIASLYGRHMYEHHLPAVVQTLTKACGNDALQLFMELLLQAAEISRKIEYDHHSARAIADDEMAKYDVYGALLSAVRQSAELLVTNNPAGMRSVISILTQNPAKIFVRLALHVLAKNPAAEPDLADAYLLDAELIEQTWAHLEYAELALAWFPSRPAANQQAVLTVVDAMPDKFRAAWRELFKQHHNAEPTAENERIFTELTIRDALWNWRSVLPPERQEAIDRIVAEHGDPDAWRNRMFPTEVSPLSGTDFSARSVPEVIAFLKTWQPSRGEQQTQTVTALAQELRSAVDKDPTTFAASADQFAGLKPIYIRRVMEGLQSATNNRREFNWSNVLKLVEFTYGQYNRAIEPASLAEGDDKNWSWACMTASELLAAGLRQGAKGIGFEHAAQVRSLAFTVLRIAPNHPELEDFEERFRRESHFAAQATLRGIAVELCILLVFWLSKDASNAIGAAPREALQNTPDIRETLEAQLADRSPDGRVPRGIIGRYLRWLFYFGEAWLKSHLAALFPADDDGLRRAAWRAHLGHDEGPLQDLVTELHSSYAEDIARLSSDRDPDFREFYQDRLADYILILHLWDGLPEDLLKQFWKDAPLNVRQHAMWFVGIQISKPGIPDDVKARGLAYWERRLAEAMQSAQPDAYRKEVGGIGQWCFHGQVNETWLCEQLLRMLGAGFAPNDAFSVIQWLQKITPRHVDRAVDVMSALLRHPGLDQWAHMTQREAVRAVLSEGLARGIPETIQRIHDTIGFLATIGETSYLDLVRPTAAE